MRFDEMELETVTLDSSSPQNLTDSHELVHAPRMRRLLALLTDASLFAALAVGLSPLLPQTRDWLSLFALAAFVVVISFYYFVGTWTLWGKTVGGAIFDVKVISTNDMLLRPDGLPAMRLRTAAVRCAGLYLSLLTGGLGFLLALLPSRRS